MAMPRRSRQPTFTAGYYRPRRHQSLHFLPPMKVKLDENPIPSSRTPTRKKKEGYDQHQGGLHSATSSHQIPFDYRESQHGRGGRYKKVVMTLTSNLTVGNVADMKFLCKGKHKAGISLWEDERYIVDEGKLINGKEKD